MCILLQYFIYEIIEKFNVFKWRKADKVADVWGYSCAPLYDIIIKMLDLKRNIAHYQWTDKEYGKEPRMEEEQHGRWFKSVPCVGVVLTWFFLRERLHDIYERLETLTCVDVE